MNNRKATFKLYPNAEEIKRLEAWLALHCELYNAALQERIEAYKKLGKSINYYDQQNMLPEIKGYRPEFIELGSQALQQTLRRLDLAFQAFFRRVKLGQTPGFPRFKAKSRFSSFSYPSPMGWKFHKQGIRGGTFRIGSGKDAMTIRARGQHRFGEDVKFNDLTIMHKNGEWFASVTLKVPEANCARDRKDNQYKGVDFGTINWATFEDGENIENPRWLRNESPQLAKLQRSRDKKSKGSIRYKRLSKKINRLHERVSNLRKDFLHKETTKLVAKCQLIATEELDIKEMTKSAKNTKKNPCRTKKQKTGLNREVLSLGLGMTIQMLKYKAEEAGTKIHLCDTKNLKPSQRCSACYEITKKTLDQRMHICQHCGHTMPRDQNSALVMLIDALTPGTGVATRPKPLPNKRGKSKSMTRETLTVTP